jgi:hypothetical protein
VIVVAGQNAVTFGLAAEFIQVIGVPFPAVRGFGLARERLTDSAFEAEGVRGFDGPRVVFMKIGPGKMAILAAQTGCIEGLPDLLAGFGGDFRQPYVVDQLVAVSRDGTAGAVEIRGKSGVDIVALKAEWKIQGKCV